MIRTVPISSYEVRCGDAPWRFASDNVEAIAAHWREVTDAKPGLWNGEILICTSSGVNGGHFTAALARSDYASFVAWRDWGRPDESVCNCFGVAAAFSSDKALLVGVMGGWTLNAGKAYPPSGTLEPRDILADGSVDLAGNMRTELLEETGLDLAHATPGEMVAIFDGPRLAIAQRHDFSLSFEDIARRFEAHKASEQQPELDRLEACWRSDETDSRMPPYAAEMVRFFHRNT